MIKLPLPEKSRQLDRPLERRAPALVDNAERRALLDPICDNVQLPSRGDLACGQKSPSNWDRRRAGATPRKRSTH